VRLQLEALEDRTVPSGFVQTNLVSDIPNLAQITDPNLKNPWGTGHVADGSFSVADQQTSVSTLYSVTAAGVSQVSPTVAIPTTAAGPQGPTGQVTNDTTSFLVNGAPASLIFDNLNGTISAWNSSIGTTAQVEATTPGAVYTGLDMGSNAAGSFLYAANPRQGTIDVFNGSFAPTSLGPNAFNDPQLPSGLVPFNVENIKGDLYVAYAPVGGRPAQISAPEGVGAVAVFDTSGNFIKQLISGDNLASPWGITLAPSSFGKFGGDLLVGNFSFAAAEILAFDPVSGADLGTLTDSSGNTLLKDAQGLWDLTFGIGGNGGDPNTLYFATGLNDEKDGLFGAIDPGAGANVSGATGVLTPSTFTPNLAAGAIRGTAGAIANDGGLVLVLDHSAFTGNQAPTSLGFSPGIQGNGLGGGAYNDNSSSLTLKTSTVTGNHANGGDSGVGGSAGQGIGGGIYNLGSFAFDAFTVIAHNHASTSNDDVFGVLTMC
jgi:uncharacterized protein (TIGR03118 family)